MTTRATMKYVIYARRNLIAPWVKIDSYSDRQVADRVADKYKRDRPYAQVKVEHEDTRRTQEN